MALSILLVDDEYPSIESIVENMDWDTAGITHVHTATSAAQARAIFAAHPVDILVCDIEMPRENGMQLLEWVSSHYPDTVSILLTCHADFAYARQGLNSGAMSYLLKPSTLEEIAAVIASARAVLQKRRDTQRYAGYGRTWEKNRDVLREQFWRELVQGSLQNGAVKARINEWELGIADGDYMLVLCSVRRTGGSFASWPQQDLEAGYIASLQEVFTPEAGRRQVLSLSLHDKLVVLEMGGDTLPGQYGLKERCSNFLNLFTTHFGCDVCLYCTAPLPLAGLAGGYTRLLEMKRGNVAYDGAIFFDGAALEWPADLAGMDLARWRSMLAEHQTAALYAELEGQVLAIVQKGYMNADLLLLIYHNLMQMVYSVLADNHISADLLLRHSGQTARTEHVLASVEEMLLFTRGMLEACVAQLKATANGQSVVGRVKRYIEEHIAEDLTRDELAKQVYLHPDYLSRLFRREEGVSLKDYITDQKMQRARQQLLHTSKTVTAIACGLGYTNMPYFSRLFRSVTGCTPQEYRSGSQK